jgi:hypothetical protein
MKSILLIIVGVLVWILIGHLFAPIAFALTAFYLPILFVLVGFRYGKNTNIYIYTLLCFILILIHDYALRLYGSGIHDDAGKGYCESAFYYTLLTSTISLLYFSILTINKKDKAVNINNSNFKIFLPAIIFVIGVSIITYLFYVKFYDLI